MLVSLKGDRCILIIKYILNDNYTLHSFFKKTKQKHLILIIGRLQAYKLMNHGNYSLILSFLEKKTFSPFSSPIENLIFFR